MKFILSYTFALISGFGYAQDHTLEYYLQSAKSKSPLLKDYQNQIAAGKVDSEMIRASYRPQVNAISNNSYSPVIGGVGYDNVITNGGQLSALVQANKSFVSKNNLASQFQTVHLQNESIGNTSQIAEKDLNKTITSQYILVYGDIVALNFNKEILDLLQKEGEILKKLTQSNIYKQTDYLTFYVSVQQQQLSLRQSDIQFKNDYAMLNYLCGIVDTAAVQLADPGLQLSNLPDIYNSVLYRSYIIDSLKNLNQHSIIDFSYKPKLNIYGDAGFISSFSYAAYRNFGVSAGLSLTIPIYDGKQRQLKYRKIEIAERTRTAYRDFFLTQYQQQIAQLKQQLQSTESLINEINNQVKYSNTLIEVNGKLLETGTVRITDFILAINTYLNARHLLNQNYINRLQIINQINYWQAM
ncbi:MAG: TolC family protein [Bacteroidetes bacterium]|nr:TolC family protein [Bacteroidota bacterium]